LTRDPVIEASLEDLLIRWWNWKSPIQPARGFNRASLGFEDYRSSRQYDSKWVSDCSDSEHWREAGWNGNGAIYDEEEAQIMRAVEREINAMDSTVRAVVYVLARALTMGISVLISPRLPENKAERDAMVGLAKVAAVDRFKAAGLI
jgi:hypothetical protein